MSERVPKQPTPPRFDHAWIASFLIASLCVLAGCRPRSEIADPHASPTATSPAHPQGRLALSNDDQIIERVRRGVSRHHLLSLPLAQVTFEVFRGEGPDACDVIVRENHEHGRGDPNTAPRLFTVRVDQTTGALTTDAHSLSTGEFQPLRD